MQMSSEELRYRTRRLAVSLSFMVLLREHPLKCWVCPCLAPDSLLCGSERSRCLREPGCHLCPTPPRAPPQTDSKKHFCFTAPYRHRKAGNQSNLEQSFPAWIGFLPPSGFAYQFPSVNNASWKGFILG